MDVFELARERGSVAGELPLATLPRLAASVLRPDGLLAYRIDGEVDERGRPGARMRIEGDLALECQRCSSELRLSLQRDARFRFVASEEELNALPLEDDDVDVIVGSHHMDIAAWIEDEAILSLPLVPRHDDCRPGVPSDGDDAARERQSPFAVLAQLKPARKSG